MLSKIELLKFIDKNLGRLLVQCIFSPKQQCFETPTSILLVRPGGIGDALLLAPAIAAIRDRYPDCIVDILAEKRNAAAFDLIPGVHHVFVYDRLFDFVKVLRRHYDVVIDTEQWHYLSAFISRLIVSRVKIGFATNERSRMFTNQIVYDLDCRETESFLNLLAPLGLYDFKLADSEGALVVPEGALQVAGDLLEPVSQPFIALFAGASIPEKRWGRDNFRTLIIWCLSEGLDVVLVGAECDRLLCEEIAFDLPAFNLAGRTSLAETAAILARASCVVSGDSGVLHLASGLCRPTVGLFGPSNAQKWAPRAPQHITLRTAPTCSPCSEYGYAPSCQYRVRCLADINTEAVCQAVADLLGLPSIDDGS